MTNQLSRRYALISPCRNEELFLKITIDSILKQTIQPSKWIIIDDNSDDQTPIMLAEAADKYCFIEVVRNERKGNRMVGPAVVDAFNLGYSMIDPDEFDYICKFDMDLELPPSYFEILIKRMEANPRIGTCSGKPYYKNQRGELVSEKCGDETSVGMTKFYRVNCFKQIGGFVREVMWDGIDCHKCRMLGWIACSWDDKELRFIHLRPMGSSQNGIITGRMRHGFGQYFMGTGLIYIFVSALYRITAKPVIVGSLFMVLGYLKSFLMGYQRFDDIEFRKFLRHYQWNCLLKGKTKATQEINERQEARWLELQQVSKL